MERLFMCKSRAAANKAPAGGAIDSIQPAGPHLRLAHAGQSAELTADDRVGHVAAVFGREVLRGQTP